MVEILVQESEVWWQVITTGVSDFVENNSNPGFN
jgi:hypothetical protein